jgi:hypothetical protein
MKVALRGLVLGLSLLLVACGDKAPPQATTAQIESASNDPKYQNPLLNIPPAQFAELLGDCGKVLYSVATPSDEKCRAEVKARASKQGVTLSDAHLDEPLVHDRYQFSMSGDKK